jgi:hypothetical protein
MKSLPTPYWFVAGSCRNAVVERDPTVARGTPRLKVGASYSIKHPPSEFHFRQSSFVGSGLTGGGVYKLLSIRSGT